MAAGPAVTRSRCADAAIEAERCSGPRVAGGRPGAPTGTPNRVGSARRRSMPRRQESELVQRPDGGVGLDTQGRRLPAQRLEHRRRTGERRGGQIAVAAMMDGNAFARAFTGTRGVLQRRPGLRSSRRPRPSQRYRWRMAGRCPNGLSGHNEKDVRNPSDSAASGVRFGRPA